MKYGPRVKCNPGDPVRLHQCDLLVTGLSQKQPLSACRGNAAYIQPFPGPYCSGSVFDQLEIVYNVGTTRFGLLGYRGSNDWKDLALAIRIRAARNVCGRRKLVVGLTFPNA